MIDLGKRVLQGKLFTEHLVTHKVYLCMELLLGYEHIADLGLGALRQIRPLRQADLSGLRELILDEL